MWKLWLNYLLGYFYSCAGEQSGPDKTLLIYKHSDDKDR